jgi:fatty acid desaturase
MAVVGTQILAVLLCGFGWFVTALPWTVIVLVWLYMLAWMFVLDGVKLALLSRIKKQDADRPHWYTRFLKGRHAAHTVTDAGKVAA